MRMDEWIAVFGSEEGEPFQNDKEGGGDDDDRSSETLLYTSSSWCDDTILRWIPATEEEEEEQEHENINDETLLLDYSSSGESGTCMVFDDDDDDDECNPRVCDLQCVCVDCLKCPHHCTCNYTSRDYQYRGIASSSPMTNSSKKTKNLRNHQNRQVRDELSSSHDGAVAGPLDDDSKRESWWSITHHLSSSSSSASSHRPKKTASSQPSFMVVPSNICTGSFFFETASTPADEDFDARPVYKGSSRSCSQQHQPKHFRQESNSESLFSKHDAGWYLQRSI
ncbi:unnamed protein product [Cylindrotheca closterium]|uniref:Uncharacterized protein n=1 Tax=Cylindrotheca closterium TaxID=2856 RepID=A0AAD2CZ54_9STRA|nr:unnamed protein product [Cylindrotheca closterium]